MFATLLGGLPSRNDEVADDDRIRDAIATQEVAGLEPIADGQPRGNDPVAAWRFASGLTVRATKQALTGPYTLARRAGGGTRRRARTAALAEEVRVVVDALVAAGCPFMEIHEPDAVHIGESPAERASFRDAHRRLADGAGAHLSLVLTGGNVDAAGTSTLLDAPYPSYTLDLIDGPDNWRVVADVPADRGVVCAALAAGTDGEGSAELLVWAAHYAASTNGRGLDRVGLANAPGLERLAWDAAVRKLERLGEAARIAALPRDGELAAALDPRAVNLRSRALRRHIRRRPRTGS